jgi:16S rRNA (uracil1498-N3)-methyltransferase
MRVLIQQGSGAAGQRVSLAENEVHHLRVRRAKDQESVDVLDGAGLIGSGVLLEKDGRWLVEIHAAERRAAPPATILGVAAGDRERFSWMVEKSAELGVTRIVPLETSRTRSVATRLKASHVDHLRRSALEAIKQCGATWAPVVDDPLLLNDFLAAPLPGTGWLADPEGEPPPAHLGKAPVAVLIGPEGGFSEAERAAIEAAGYQRKALGPHTLRFETAAMAAAVAVAQARMRGSG